MEPANGINQGQGLDPVFQWADGTIRITVSGRSTPTKDAAQAHAELCQAAPASKAAAAAPEAAAAPAAAPTAALPATPTATAAKAPKPLKVKLLKQLKAPAKPKPPCAPAAAATPVQLYDANGSPVPKRKRGRPPKNAGLAKGVVRLNPAEQSPGSAHGSPGSFQLPQEIPRHLDAHFEQQWPAGLMPSYFGPDQLMQAGLYTPPTASLAHYTPHGLGHTPSCYTGCGAAAPHAHRQHKVAEVQAWLERTQQASKQMQSAQMRALNASISGSSGGSRGFVVHSLLGMDGTGAPSLGYNPPAPAAATHTLPRSPIAHVSAAHPSCTLPGGPLAAASSATHAAAGSFLAATSAFTQAAWAQAPATSSPAEPARRPSHAGLHFAGAVAAAHMSRLQQAPSASSATIHEFVYPQAEPGQQQQQQQQQPLHERAVSGPLPLLGVQSLDSVAAGLAPAQRRVSHATAQLPEVAVGADALGAQSGIKAPRMSLRTAEQCLLLETAGSMEAVHAILGTAASLETAASLRVELPPSMGKAGAAAAAASVGNSLPNDKHAMETQVAAPIRQAKLARLSELRQQSLQALGSGNLSSQMSSQHHWSGVGQETSPHVIGSQHHWEGMGQEASLQESEPQLHAANGKCTPSELAAQALQRSKGDWMAALNSLMKMTTPLPQSPQHTGSPQGLAQHHTGQHGSPNANGRRTTAGPVPVPLHNTPMKKKGVPGGISRTGSGVSSASSGRRGTDGSGAAATGSRGGSRAAGAGNAGVSDTGVPTSPTRGRRSIRGPVGRNPSRLAPGSCVAAAVTEAPWHLGHDQPAPRTVHRMARTTAAAAAAGWAQQVPRFLPRNALQQQWQQQQPQVVESDAPGAVTGKRGVKRRAESEADGALPATRIKLMQSQQLQLEQLQVQMAAAAAAAAVASLASAAVEPPVVDLVQIAQRYGLAPEAWAFPVWLQMDGPDQVVHNLATLPDAVLQQAVM